jgi:pseudouridine-5'-phosphate glycosidase
MAQRATRGTTVAATMIAAHAGGVTVFATGGIGGVHRGSSSDVSADLPELARTPVVVVCAGAKAILDLPRTLEWLETAGVPVLGWGTDDFPAFFTRSSGLPVSARVGDAAAAAALIRTQWGMGLRSGVLVCVPCPEEVAIPAEVVEPMLRAALQQAEAEGVRGKQVTPFLLSRLADLTGGTTLRANLALLRNNAALQPISPGLRLARQYQRTVPGPAPAPVRSFIAARERPAAPIGELLEDIQQAVRPVERPSPTDNAAGLLHRASPAPHRMD